MMMMRSDNLELNLPMGCYLSVNNVNFLVNNVQFYSVNSISPKGDIIISALLNQRGFTLFLIKTQFLIILHLSIVCRTCKFFL